MAKTGRKWMDLNPLSLNSVMAQHIYTNKTFDDIFYTIQDRMNQIQKTRCFNVIRNDSFTVWDSTNTPLNWIITTDGTAGVHTYGQENTIVRTGVASLKVNITTMYTTSGIRITADVNPDCNVWVDSKYCARAYVRSSVASAMRISVDTYNGSTWTNGVYTSAYNTTVNAYEDLIVQFSVTSSSVKQIRYNIEIKNGVTGTFYLDGASLVETDFPLFLKNQYDSPLLPIPTINGVIPYWNNVTKSWAVTNSNTIYDGSLGMLSLGTGTTTTQDLINFNNGAGTKLRFRNNIFGYNGFNAVSFETSQANSTQALWAQSVYNSYLGCGTTQTTGEAHVFVYRNSDPTTNTNLNGLVFGYTYNETSPWLGLQYQNGYAKGLRFIATGTAAVMSRIEINPEFKPIDFVVYKNTSGNAYYYTALTDIHTFSSLPFGPSSAPTSLNQFANKQYVDDQIAIIQGQIDSGDYVLPAATQNTLGGIKVGNNLSIDGNGVLSATTAAVQVCIINETQPNNTSGGTFTSGAWRTRVLNTTKLSQTWATLTTNQITLQPGNYLIKASTPAFRVGKHTCRLQSISGDSISEYGTAETTLTTSSAEQSRSFIDTAITLTQTTVLELQHRCATTYNTTGFGAPSNFGNVEIYSQINITKY
jgi:hypothetical protein